MFTGIHGKLVDKRMFTTLLTQLKAAVLVQYYTNYLLKPNCLTHSYNMKTLIVLTVAH